MDTVDRIFDLLDKTTMEQKEFAALVGVSVDTASDWRRRRSGSYAKKIARIAEVLNTTPEYLLTGAASEPEPDDDPLWGRMRELYMRLPPQKRVEAFENFVKEYSELPGAHSGHKNTPPCRRR